MPTGIQFGGLEAGIAAYALSQRAGAPSMQKADGAEH